MADIDNTLTIYPSRLKTVALLLLCLAIVVTGASVFIFRTSLGMPLLIAAIVVVLLVPFGCIGAGYALYRILLRRPAIVIDQLGITDNASALGVGFLSWDEIRDIVVFSYTSQKWIGIIPRDPNALYARLGPVKSRLLRLNHKIGTPAISIPQTLLSMKLENLRAELEKHFPVRDALVPEGLFVVECSDVAVSCTRPDGRTETVQWDDLRRVEIRTTDTGPFAMDVFWILHGSAEGCVIPQGATGEGDLITRLQELPGFSNDACAKAMGSTTNQQFVCWQKTDPNCL